jgi:hypothetical protein
MVLDWGVNQLEIKQQGNKLMVMVEIQNNLITPYH